MKKLVLGIALAALMLSGCGKKESKEHNASAEANFTVEKQGFLTTKWCAEQGMFADCRMESIVCGEGECNQKWEFGDKEKMELVLYVHDDLKYYELDIAKLGHEVPELLETAINRDQVIIKGDFGDGNKSIVATAFEAPPPPTKSFFKGCL